jgi:sec-independent protein translocase protein TatA
MTAILLAVPAFFSIGGGEIFFILLVVLLFFGSKNLPELARGLGKGIKEIRHATDSIKREIQDSAGMDDEAIQAVRKEVEESKKVMEEAEGAIRRGMKS